MAAASAAVVRPISAIGDSCDDDGPTSPGGFMAQDRAASDTDAPKAQPDKETTITGAVLLPEVEEEVEIVEDDESETGSIDKLLALTDQGWDIDEQVRTLKVAADEQAAPREAPAPMPRSPSLMIPSPAELAKGAPPPTSGSLPASVPPPPQSK